MKGSLARRCLTAVALVPPSTALFGYVGYLWYALTKPSWSQFGQSFEGFSQVALGMALGGVTALFAGGLDVASPRLSWTMRVVGFVSCAIAAGLVLVAISSIFMFNDHDGPHGVRPYLFAAAFPAAAGVLVVLARVSRHGASPS